MLIGNGVNTMSKGISWEDLLDKIIHYCGSTSIKKDKSKPFPLFYEEIFAAALQSQAIVKEVELKTFIGKQVSDIARNQVHVMIQQLAPAHVMTLNYEFLLEGKTPKQNEGLVREKLYSVFRKYTIGGTTYWHLHGDCRYPITINLGYEHYGGQLQQMRNYVATATNYANASNNKLPFVKRMEKPDKLTIQSWADLFFLKDIHILGATLDFVETDLWWLLTFRARQLRLNRRITISNTIYYYIPKPFAASSRFKLDLLEANFVKVVEIDLPHSVNYYEKIIAGM